MEEHVLRALAAGAVGYLSKSVDRAQLALAVRRVSSGQVHLKPDLEERLAKVKNKPRISPREMEVLEFVRNGLANRDITTVLGVSDHSVKSTSKLCW